MTDDKGMVAGEPHYIREYRRMISSLRKRSANEEEVMERAVGGAYEKTGAVQAALIDELIPERPIHIIDVGCGSGRLAYALRGQKRIAYSGFDIMADLVEYAKSKCGRSDWRLETISTLQLPVPNACADMVVFMSVFTHLKPGEIKIYIKEALRVLKPGGLVVASYLDPNEPRHTKGWLPAPLQLLARLLGRDVMLTRTSQKMLAEWLTDGGFVIERAIDDGSFGQHVLIASKSGGQIATADGSSYEN
ncbi:methyltransferase domain-containing protein [Hyphococcus flavus]|uniref:Methyltransferase domain-containing protein n=1 Tax=Hyphococcus flavus TaxID=1866326 RepID=A0AAF0CH50_9PROT|nr:methyltransferase domain-containing protein [Hyphococcus flavus]WDI31512.1 methyltransferase domain-containing protein [Hyphococcus flavus]